MAADPLLPGPLWLVGCGNMAGAMLEGWAAAGVDPSHVSVIRPSGRSVGHGIRVTTAFPEDEVPAVVLLGMKPHQLDEVAPLLAPILDPGTILVSILAGTELATLRDRFPAPRTLVRAMPNLPVGIGKGVTGLCAEKIALEPKAEITGLMAALGHALWVEDEDHFNLIAALAGAGPAFLFRFIDALAEAGAALGLPRDLAGRLALATVEGAGAYAAREPLAPVELARRVASPGGMTQAGLDVLDEEDALKALVLRTIDAARRRGLEMAAAARESRAS